MPSIVGSNEELNYRSDIGDRIRLVPLSLNGHSYLVGEAARRFSRHRYRIFDSTWAESRIGLRTRLDICPQLRYGSRPPALKNR
jgi:hypothetical protein